MEILKLAMNKTRSKLNFLTLYYNCVHMTTQDRRQ